MKKIAIIAIALWSAAACSKEEPAAPTGVREIRIAAEIGQTENPSAKAQCLTRASETAFEKDDEIGLRVEYPSEVGHRNACMIHNGNVFTGRRVMWNETAGDAVLSAYYPYNKNIDDIPMIFSVPQNQRDSAAFASADFLAASRSVTVEEFAEPVQLQFRHVLSKVIFNVVDETGKNLVIDRIAIKGFNHVAAIDYAARTATAADNVAAMIPTVSGHKVENLKHEVILVPQTDEKMMIEVYAKANGSTLLYQKRAKNVEMKSGYRYKLNITLRDGEGEEVIDFAAAAEIKQWLDNEDVLPDTQV